VEVARILLEPGADTETRDKGGDSQLDWASAEGHVDVARLLLKHGADANTQGLGGRTPLHIASVFGCVGIARVLLEHHGVDANARDANHSTPLHLASSRSYNLEERLDVVQLLIQNGSDIHARNNKGRTPFMTATEEECQEIMQFLLECGAEDHRK
jgi:ankyrin repeat protein